MVRNALAMVRLLNREVRDDPAAPARRSAQRAHGDTVWGLDSDLVADDLRGVLPAHSPTHPPAGPPAPELEDYDMPIPMDEADTEELADLPTRLTVLRVG